MGEWPLRTSSLRERTAVAVADPVLRRNVAGAVDRFTAHRADALAGVHDPDGLRQAARGVRSEVQARWSEVLSQLADNVTANGGHVHWAVTADEANDRIAAIARQAGARRAVKSKSMVTEETGLRPTSASGSSSWRTSIPATSSSPRSTATGIR
jgi:L-lactate dehydrogenase complex protein LldF